MSLKEQLRHGLEHTRGFTDQVLSEIVDDNDWVRRPVPDANHALWIAGHLAFATNAFIGFVDPTRKDNANDGASLFGKGIQSVEDLNAYPKPGDVAQYLTERGRTFIELLSETEDFDRVVTEGPAFMHDVGAVFQMAIWHEALHSGQLTVIHRMIGQPAFTSRNSS
ncbi:MAG: DinB family protein [Rubripirellula sp.]